MGIYADPELNSRSIPNNFTFIGCIGYIKKIVKNILCPRVEHPYKITELHYSNQRPNLKNVCRGLNFRRGSNIVGST